MKLKNPWVGYLDRNFIQIKTKILERMGQTVPEMTDHSDSNILVYVIESFSGVAEMLNYYIDNMAREAFIATCRRYSSAVKHTRLIDYRIKSIVPSSTDITIQFKNVDDTPYALPIDIIIPSGIIFNTLNNVEFRSIKDIMVTAGSTSTVIGVEQKTLVLNDNIGTTTNSADQVYSLGKNYVNDSIELVIGTDPWNYKTTLGRSKSTDKDFIVDVSANKEAYIKFGDGINGQIPNPGLNIIATYYTSLGSKGNVEIGNIQSSTFDFTSLGGIPNVSIYNHLRSTGGTDFEDIERIRRSAPLSLRTLLRAVTPQDYDDIALLAPGVDKAKHYFDCGKYVYIYIAPNGGGIASNVLLSSVENYFSDKKMITTFVKALPAGESQIFIDLEVTGKFRVNGPILRSELIELLLDKYSYKNSDINKPTRVSDLIALIDNHPKVDYLTLNKLNIKPYFRPIGNNELALNANIIINDGCNSTTVWKIKYDGLYMMVFKDNTHKGNKLIGETYDDLENVMSITFEAGAYVIGMEWEFKTIPINVNQVIDDYSVPVLSLENINLIVNEQLAIN